MTNNSIDNQPVKDLKKHFPSQKKYQGLRHMKNYYASITIAEATSVYVDM